MQAAHDIHLLNITQSGNGLVVAEQVPGNVYFPAVTISVLCVIASLYLAWTRRWAFTAIPVAVILLAFFVRSSGTTYRLSIDENKNELTWQGFRRGKEVLHGSATIAGLATCDIAFGKAGGRLVLIHQDGTQDLPLGETYTTNEPVQFLLVKEIQSLIRSPAQ